MKNQKTIDKQFEDILKWANFGQKVTGNESVEDRLLLTGDSTFRKLKELYPAISPIYTNESILDIENNFDTFLKSEISVSEPLLSFLISIRSACIGTYIGLTFVANYGGELVSEPDKLYVECEGVKAFPVRWVLSRHDNGKEDDLFFKYQTFTEMVSGEGSK